MTDLPDQFNERIRPDIIKRAVLSIQANNRQPYGSDSESGLKHVTYWKKRNDAYRGQKGRGQARTPRKIMFSRGSQMVGTGAEAPNTVGGRRAHPPKAEKDFSEDINDKERRKAIRSAISATADIELVSEKHEYDGELPIIQELKDIEKTSQLREKLEELGMEDELERCERNVRAGRGTSRGRKYSTSAGPLIVTDNDKDIARAASNLQGVSAESVENLNAELLAPGSQPGRLTVWTPEALEKLEDEELFR